MSSMIRRNGLGRVEGSGFNFNTYEEQETYKDMKEANVIFPNHADKMPSEVHTYSISELNKEA